MLSKKCSCFEVSTVDICYEEFVMKKLLLLSLSVLLVGLGAAAAVIRGKVADESASPLPGVTAQLIQYPDSVRKGFIVTGAKGDFSFKGIKPGNYSLRLTMVGMDDLERTIAVSDTTRTLDVGTLKMQETATVLKEAVVTGVKAAVVAKQDTMEFNAGSYKTKVNASVEDLLKKLPGVEVGSDGSITSGGKTVTKVLVDGKEFFGEDTKMATKNLPSDMVDKVQVVDRKSDLARITGVDDGEEETVINLTVKKNMKNGWFGTVQGGYGTDKRYEGSFNISTFNDNNQISFVGGANNTNDLGFSDGGRGRFMSFGPGGGITTSQRFGINFNLGKSDKFRVGGNIFYTHSDQKTTSFKDTQYLFPDSTSYQTQGSASRDRGHNVNADFRMEWKIDDNNTLDFRPHFSFNSRHSELNDTSFLRAGDALRTLVNSNETERFNHGTSYNVGGRLIFNHKFASHPGRSFSVQANYEFTDTKQHTTTWSDIEYYLRQDDSETLYRFMDNHQWNNSVGARLTWTEPLGDVKRGNFLQVAYRLNFRFNNANKDTYNIPIPEGVEAFRPADLTGIPADAEFSGDLSNRFRNKFMTHELQVGYKKVNKKYTLEAGMAFQPSSSSSKDLINDARNIPTRSVWNVAPFARFRYRFSKTKAIRVDYRARTSQPSLTQLQPVADVSDPLNIVKGNPELKPTFTQSLNIHFNNYNTATQQSMFAAARLQYSSNVVVNRTVTDRETGVRTTEYTNASGNFSGFGMFMLNQPFRNRNWRFSVRARARYSSSAGYINGEFNRSGNLNLAPNAGITFTSDIFQMSVNPNYSFNMATNSLPQQRNQYTHSYGFNTDASLYLPFGLELNTDLTFDKSTGYSAGFNTSSWLWNAQISYSFLRDKSLTLSVRAYDILAQNRNISRSVSANQITDGRYNDLTRYVMFGISYTFNTLKNKKRPDTDRFGDHPGPPPGERRGHGGMRPMGPPPGGPR